MPAKAGDERDTGLISGSGISPGEGNDSLLQYSCLENPVDRRAWWATVPGVAEWDITEVLNNKTTICNKALSIQYLEF